MLSHLVGRTHCYPVNNNLCKIVPFDILMRSVHSRYLRYVVISIRLILQCITIDYFGIGNLDRRDHRGEFLVIIMRNFVILFYTNVRVTADNVVSIREQSLIRRVNVEGTSYRERFDSTVCVCFKSNVH